MATSGIQRFHSLIGGEANMPAELPPQAEPAALTPVPDDNAKASENPSDGLPSVQAFDEQSRSPEEQANGERPKTPEGTHSRFTSQFLTSPAPLLSDADNLSQMAMGEPAPRGFSFSPFLPVTRFCYKFVGPQWSQPLATAFFDANKIYNRSWDV